MSMKSNKKLLSASFNCDDIPMPVIVHRKSDGLVLRYNQTARKLFQLPVKIGKAVNIRKLRPEKLPLVSLTTPDGFNDFGILHHKTFKGINISLSVLQKHLMLDNAEYVVDFLKDQNEITSLKSDIIKTSLDAFVSMNESQIIEDWNMSAERIFGWKKNAVIGKRLHEIIIPLNQRKKHKEGFNHFLKTGKHKILNRLVEITALHKKGHEFPIELTITSVEENGKRLFYSFIRDISERAKIENKLKESESNLNKAQAIASIGSWEMQGKFNETYWSDEFYRIHGLEPQSIKPSTKFRLSMTHPKDRIKLQHAIDGAVKEGRPYSIEKRIIRPDGKIRWVLSRGEASLDTKGKRKIFGTIIDITILKENEEKQTHLNKSLSDFQNAIQSSSIVSRANKSGVITYVNKNFETVSGYSAGELIGKDHRIINSAYHPKTFWIQMWKAIASGKSWRAEVKNKAKDGSYYWVDTFIMPFTGADGKVQEFLSIRNDITQRKNNEIDLVSKTRTIDNMLNGITDGFFATDRELNFVVVNPVFATMANMKPEQMIGKNMLALFPAMKNGERHLAYQKAIETGKSSSIESRNFTNSNQIFQINIYPNPDGICIYFRDISKSKKAEENLAVSELKNRLIVEHSGDGILFSTPDGKIFSGNPEACKIFGMSEKEICSIGRDGIVDRTDPNLPIMLQTRQEKGIYNGELRMRRKDGSLFTAEVTSKLFVNPNGEMNTTFILRDISKRKAAEIALEKSENDLRAILNSSADINLFIDREGKISAANTQAISKIKKLLGTEFKLGDKFVDLLPERFKSNFENHFQRSLAGEIINLESETKFDKTTIWIQSCYSPVLDIKKKIIGISLSIIDISERKKAEKALIQNWEGYKNIFEANPLPMWILDNKTLAFLEVNDTAVMKYGYTKEEFSKMTLWDIKQEKDKHQLSESLKQNRGGYMNVGDTRHKLKNGSVIDVEIFAHGIFYKERDCRFIVSSDITARKKADLEVRTSEERFKSLYNNTPAMMHSIDAEGKLIRVSDYWLRKMGYSREEVIGQPSINFLTDESRELAIREVLPEFFLRGKIVNQEYNYITKYGKILETLISATSEQDESGKIIRSMAVITDVTYKNKLERENANLAMIANRTSNIVIFTDDTGRITWVNDGFERITEYKLKDVVGKKPGSFLQGSETDLNTVKVMSDAISKGEDFRVELLNYSKSGRSYWTDIEVMALKKSDGTLTGYMAIQSDITPLKLAIFEMLNSQARLQTMMDNAPMVVFMKDKQGRYTFFNEAYRKAINHIQLKTGFTDHEIFDKDFADDCRAKDLTLLETGEAISFEHLVGNREYYETKFPIRDHAGKIYALGGMSIDVTERNKLARQLKEKDESLLSIAKNISGGVIYQYRADSNGKIIAFPFVSDGAENLYGVPAQRIVEDPMVSFAMVHPDDLDRMLSEAEKSRTSLTQFDFEYRIINARNELKWIHTRSHPKREANGDTLWDGISLDITDKKILEENIRESEERFRTLIQDIKIGVLLQDVNATMYLCNQAALDLMGLSEEQMLGKTSYDPVWAITREDGTDFPLEELPVPEAIKTKKPMRSVVMGINRPVLNDRIWLEVDVIPRFDKDGNVISVISTINDITMRKHQQEELFKSKKYLESLLNSQTSYLIRTDLAGKYTFVNKKFQEKFNYAHEELIGINSLETISTDDRDKCRDAMIKCILESGQVVPVTLRSPRKDGGFYWTEWEFVAMQNENGEVMGLQGVGLDSTERITALEKLRESEDRLKTVARNIPQGSIYQFLVTPGGDYSFPFITEGIFSILGLKPKEVSIDKNRLLELIHPADVTQFQQSIKQSALELSEFHNTARFRDTSGNYKWLTAHSKPKRLPDGSTLWDGVMLDETDRKKAEDEILKMSRLYKLTSNINQMVVHAVNKDELFYEACRIAVTHGKFHMAWIGLIDRNTKTVKPVVWDGFEDGYFSVCPTVSTQNIPSGRGPTGRAVREASTVFNNNISDRTDESYTLWRDEALKRNYQSTIGLPIIIRGKVRGVFSLYKSEPFFFTEKEVQLLEEVTSNIAFGLAAIENQNEKQIKETALIDSEERFRSLVRDINIGVLLQGPKSEIILCNQAALDLLGVTEDQLLGRTSFDKSWNVIHEDRSEFNGDDHPVPQAIRTKQPVRGVVMGVYRPKKKDRAWLLVDAIPRVDDFGKVKDVICTFNDITQIKEIERNLQFTHFTIDHSSDPIFWIRPDGSLADYNTAAHKSLGYSFHEMSLLHIPDIDVNYSEEVWPSHWAELRDKKAMTFVSRQKRRDGTEFDVEINANFIVFEEQEFNCAFVRDITERKKSENALLASNQEKDLLIKEIHHRVKNNLQLISSILYIKMSGMKESEIKTFLEDTRQKIRSIALIHERLLQTESVNEVDISDYLGKLIADLQMSNSRQDLNLIFNTEIDSEKFHLDVAIYCGLIINELVTNSLKHAFTNRSMGTIQIHFKKLEKGHRLMIKDDGSSLPENITIGKNGNFGMQLLEIFIKQLNGTVEVTRKNGTCFEIWINA
jgi:PAS domain S-box-containing protein